jgi:RHS repeat-associated protein
VLGPWRTVAVKQGDRVQAQVYAYYTSTAASGQRVQLTAFVDGQATSPATGEQTSNLWDKLKVGLSFPLASTATAPQDNTVPVAYLKYIFYDHNYNPTRDLIVPVTSAALAANGGWEGLSFDITASEEGYVQVLVANESDKAVWFDDLQIKHSPALIVQENHYDPWGLNLTGIEKQGQPDYKFQYLGREKQSELGLNWLDLQARMYDPQLGRFHAVDPLADEAEQETQSPYQYGYNNPITNSDPDGDCPKCLKAIAKTAIKSVIKGKVDLGEVYDAVDAVKTITDVTRRV